MAQKECYILTFIYKKFKVYVNEFNPQLLHTVKIQVTNKIDLIPKLCCW